jgi:hypothetical protein
MVATVTNPRGVTTFSQRHSITVARYSTVVEAVPSTVYYTAIYEIKIYYLMCNLKV